jgi:hypothetical protein
MRFFPKTMIVLLALAIPSIARAATISFDVGEPSAPGVLGKANATGTYTLAVGESFGSITLFAVNPTGGKGGQIICMFNSTTKTWSGAITGLPTGTYNVFAVFAYANMGIKYYNTKVVSLAVP